MGNEDFEASFHFAVSGWSQMSKKPVDLKPPQPVIPVLPILKKSRDIVNLLSLLIGEKTHAYRSKMRS